MKPGELKKLKNRIKASGLSYPQVYENTGISRGWFLRMIRGDFLDPNPEWIEAITGFLDGWDALKKAHKIQ